MKVTALAGGTGSSKLLIGLQKTVKELTVVANVADNFYFYGLYVCPDIDIACYSLSGISNRKRGWGISGDTFNLVKQLGKLGFENWFKLGDSDAAISLLRTWMLYNGKSLTEITKIISRSLGLKEKVLPASDQHYETHIITEEKGEMHLQEFWVKFSGRLKVLDVIYKDIEKASFNNEAIDEIDNSDILVFCPANPITSLMPILRLKGVKELIEKSNAKKIAISPVIGNKPFSGPAGSLMRSKGLEVGSYAVALLYKGLIDNIIIHYNDSKQKEKIESLGINCYTYNTEIKNRRDSVCLAKKLLEI